jgi:hypothetical protein
MKRLLVPLSIMTAALLMFGLSSVSPPQVGPPAVQAQATQKAKHTTPPPIHSAKGVIASPYSKEHFKFPRGLKKTPRYKLISSHRFVKTGITSPAQVMMLPKQLSMWGNSQYGDCVSASEAARKAAYSVFCGLPETFVPEATLIAWAQKGGFLDGADLTDVMAYAATNGMVASDGKTYLDGPYSSVDYSDESALQAALATGPVNFGIDADALPSAAGNQNGWYVFGGTPGQFTNEDHCTPSFGYVTGPTSAATAFAAISAAYGVNVSPPANAPSGNVYLWFTWNSVGVVDHPWIMSTAGEAWICSPTTIGQSPTPTPVPPTPTPTPVPPTPTPIPPVPGPYPSVTFTGSQWGAAAGTYTQIPATMEIAPLGLGVWSANVKAAIAAPLTSPPPSYPHPQLSLPVYQTISGSDCSNGSCSMPPARTGLFRRR